MTTRRGLLVSLVVAVTVSASCDAASDAERPSPTEPSSSPTDSSSTTSRFPTPPTGTSSTTAVPSTTAGRPAPETGSENSEGAPTMRSDQTSVRVDGGRLDVAGDGAVLVVVAVETAPGWEVEIDRPTDRQLEASFIGDRARTDVTVTLTAGGIRSSTRSTRGG